MEDTNLYPTRCDQHRDFTSPKTKRNLHAHQTEWDIDAILTLPLACRIHKVYPTPLHSTENATCVICLASIVVLAQVSSIAQRYEYHTCIVVNVLLDERWGGGTSSCNAIVNTYQHKEENL